MKNAPEHGTVSHTLFLQLIFLISGIFQTVLVNLVSYHGGASPSTILPVFTSYLAMAVVYFLPKSNPKNITHHSVSSDPNISNSTSSSQTPSPKKIKKKNKKFKNNSNVKMNTEIKIMLIALYDVICGIISFLSLVWSGSGTFQLVYSSIIIITATFRNFILPNKKLTIQQWISCIIVTFGLLLSGFGSHSDSDTTHNAHTISLSFKQLLWPLITTILYAFEYVLIEKLLSSPNPPNDNEVCYKMGFYGLIFVCLYIIFSVLPNWNQIFIHEIQIHNGSPYVIICSYCCIFIANFAHNWSYFILLNVSGAVSTGINQAVRAVGVFVISGICFCHLQESQCFNSFKFLSLIIVIGGVLRYAFITAMNINTSNKNNDGLYMMIIDDTDKHLV